MSSNNIMKVAPSVAAACVRTSYETRTPLMLWGPPGTAKSAVVRQTAEDMGIDFIDLRLVQIDSLDLRGMPYKTELQGPDGQMHVAMGFAPSTLLPRRGQGILFLDELPQAPTLVQNAASELLLDRRVGEYILPDGWSVICAGNRRTDRAGTLEVPSHIKNRIMHIEVKTSLDDWLAWASSKGIHPHVIAFLKSSPEHLYKFDADSLAYPTLRSWEFVSRVLHSKVEGKVREALIHGCVGEAAGTQLCVYIERAVELPSYEDVISDPARVPIPRAAHASFALMGMVASNAKLEHSKEVIKFFQRCPAEEARFSLVSMLEANKLWKEQKEFKALYEKLEGVAA